MEKGGSKIRSDRRKEEIINNKKNNNNNSRWALTGKNI